MSLARGATALWIGGVVLLAAATALGGRALQDHLVARRAWLAASAEVGRAGYDAQRSDALYTRSDAALGAVRLWTRIGGAGLVALAAGLALRRRARSSERAPGSRRRAWIAAILAAAAALATHLALTSAGSAVIAELFAPAASTVGNALAPLAGIAVGAALWLGRRRPAARPRRSRHPASTSR